MSLVVLGHTGPEPRTISCVFSVKHRRLNWNTQGGPKDKLGQSGYFWKGSSSIQHRSVGSVRKPLLGNGLISIITAHQCGSRQGSGLDQMINCSFFYAFYSPPLDQNPRLLVFTLVNSTSNEIMLESEGWIGKCFAVTHKKKTCSFIYIHEKQAHLFDLGFGIFFSDDITAGISRMWGHVTRCNVLA